MQYFTVKEPTLLIYVTKYLDHWGGAKPSIESGWRIDRERAQHRLILARDNDRVIGAYRSIDGSWVRKTTGWKEGRWFFRVEHADDVWDDYVGKLVLPGLVSRFNRPMLRYLDPQD